MIGGSEEEPGSVITHRLRQSLTPLELWLYSLDSLSFYLAQTFAADLGDDTYDSWGLEDFVAHGLELAVRYDSFNRGAIAHWVRQEVWKRKRRQQRYSLRSDLPSPAIPPVEWLSCRLPDEVREWVEYHVPPTVAEGLVLVSEQGWTVNEVCASLGVEPSMFNRSLRYLRKLVKEDHGNGQENHQDQDDRDAHVSPGADPG